MLEKELEKYFSFSQFRPGQKEVVEAIIDGKDVVALMPTGGGKSLCFQLPAILSEKISIVISPLIALMQDQVDALNA
ncbi:MAG TPA: DNA helicase RecQ, partial [Candidatus Moranbacteria bacterium]|nr:DNA helicase RecQ [Candidatus Moranbacteria bacterium]